MDDDAIKTQIIAIGKQLKKIRIEQGYTSYENFAFEHELSSRFYWEVENGRNISLEYLLKLLAINDIPLKDFINSLE